jgi:hypothetical protein
MTTPENTSGDVSSRLGRVNLMLTRQDSAWLDQLANEIRSTTGAKVSRSEIVRAALSMLRELDRLAPLCSCKSGDNLAAMGIVAARKAALL